MSHHSGHKEQFQSPQESSWAEIQPGNTRQTPEHNPSLYNLLYCLNCVSDLGSKVTEYTTPGSVWGREDEPQAAKGGQIHKVRCSCGERFWKLAEWERHEVEQSWETPTEPHLAQCEKCSNQVFEKRERFLEVFKPLLVRETTETNEKYRCAIEKANFAAADPDADPSFTTKFYSSAAIDSDEIDEINTFKSLPSFGEDEYVYGGKGYIQKALENHKCRYISMEESLLTEPTFGPQDGTFVRRHLEKRRLPEPEIDSFEFDTTPDLKRMRADPSVYPDMMDMQ